MEGLALFLNEAGDYSAGQWFITNYEDMPVLSQEQEALGRKFAICVWFGEEAAADDLPKAASNAFLNLAHQKQRGQAIGS